MKTSKITIEINNISKKIDHSKKTGRAMSKNNLAEDISFEIELVDDLLAEIKLKNNLEEGIFDFLKGIFKGFSDFINTNIKQYFGMSSGTYTASRTTASTTLGKDPAEELDPDKNPEDLVIWGYSQIYVEDGLNEIKESLGRLNVLPAPIPSQEEDEAVKWQEGGDYYQIVKDISKAGAIAVGVARTMGSDDAGQVRALKPVAEQIEQMTLDESERVISILKAVILLCKNVIESPWRVAIRKAAEINKEKFLDKGLKVDSETSPTIAGEIQTMLEGEIARLENAKKEIEQSTAGSEETAGGNTEGTPPETGAFENHERLRNSLDSILREILS